MIALVLLLVLGSTDPLEARCKKGDPKACLARAEAIVDSSEPGEDEDASAWFEAACDLDAQTCLRGSEWAMTRNGHLVEFALELLQKACAKDVAAACVAAGPFLERPGVGDAPKPVAALQAFEHACRLGSPAGCVELGRMLRDNRQTPQDPKKARVLWQKGCEGGHAPACIALASADRDGWGGPPNRTRALELYDGACNAKSKEACMWAKFERARGTLAVAPDEPARDAILAACPRGSGQPLPCWLRSRLIRLGRAKREAGETYDGMSLSLCKASFPRGCIVEFAAIVNGDEKGDYDSATNALKEACDRSEPDACAWLGFVLYNGKWREKDQKRGAELCADACARGSEDGCARWGMLQVSGVGTPKDEAGGLATLDRLCEGGNWRGCEGIVKMAEGKLITDPDGAKAKTYRDKACRLGRCK